MAKLTDMQIKAWIKAGERFEGRADGDGLWLRFREADKVPVWRYRYRFEGKQRTMQICPGQVFSNTPIGSQPLKPAQAQV
jgi:hypothetical protein